MADSPTEEHSSTDPNDPVLEHIYVDEALGRKVFGSLFGVYALFVLIGALTWNVILLDFGLKVNLGYWFFFAVILHVTLSVINSILHTDKLGTLYFFGTPIKVYKSSGLKFVPWGLINLDLLPKDMQEIHAPGPRDKIFWGDDEEPVPPGMVRAIRMTTKAPEDAEKDPLDAQLTVGIGYFVFWTISDPVQFRAHIRTIPEADSQIRLMSQTSLGEVIVKYTASGAIENQAAINASLDDYIRAKTKGWGVQINRTGLIQINLSHALASAMRDRAKARFEKETKILTAEGEARSIELISTAEGNGARARAAGEILGRVDGMKTMMTELKVDGNQVLAAETTRGVLADADTIIVGAENGLRDLLGAVKASTTVLGKGKK